ncbi:MAG TPA: DegQ family serine endoprotease [Desulfobulbus sp.]|nr:DegQ family serine endoprotease [Desulfobulbus sp.]
MNRVSKSIVYSMTAVFVFSVLLLTTATGALAGDDENIALLAKTGKDFAAVVKKAQPAVVYIGIEKSIQAAGGPNPYDFFNDPFFQRFFGPQFRHPRVPHRREFKQRGAGSGFIIAKNGYILTNNHVVADADKITVRLSDEREFKAKVVGTDPQSDVALIKIDGKNLPVLPLGNSDKIQVGEWVIAIGNPFELMQTVTVGVVSAKGRNRMGISEYENYIQTDAAINPGNSGGPLLNIHGEAIGINSAIFSKSGGYMGIGFAIPINMAKNIEQQLLKNGKVTRGWLGVIIQDMNEDLARSFNLKTDKGVLISEVSKDSPADKAGLKQGDVVLAIDGKAVENVAGLRNTIAMTAPGTKLVLKVIRDGKTYSIPVTIGRQPADFESRATSHGGSPLAKMGLTLQNLTPELADQFGYHKGQGVLIAGVDPDSPAGRVGLQAGQLIEEVNKIRVHNLKELKKALRRTKNKKQVLLRVRAGEYSQYVVLRAE